MIANEKRAPIYKTSKCNICGMTTMTRKAMKRHLDTMHDISKHPKRYYGVISE